MTDCIRQPGSRKDGARPMIGRRRAYQVRWEEAHGPIPPGLVLHHLCGNAWCVNVEHLTLMTQSAHAAQHLIERNRRLGTARTHCANGHAYDDANTLWVNSERDGRYRRCRICALAAKRRYRGQSS